MRRDVEAELLGIWSQPNKEGALTQLAAFKATYGQLYPEAVQSLTEEEEKALTFYEFPQTMHRSIRTTDSIESLFSNVRQRTDQIDVFSRCDRPSSDKGRGSLQEHVSHEPALRVV